LKEINPDIIYVLNEPLAIDTFLAVIYAKRLGKKIFCFSWENLFMKKNLIIRNYEKFVIKNMRSIVAGSDDAKKLLVRKGYDPEKIYVLPEVGIDMNFFRPEKRNLCKKLNIKKELTCLFMGRLEHEKGLEYILEAKNILDKKSRQYYYLFVGDGSLFKKLEHIALSDKKIRLLKWTRYEDLPHIYNSTAIFLYPSIPTPLWEEQFGYSIVEAMACGLPTVSTDMTGPREIIKDKIDGFIIPPKDAKILSEKIDQLMSNKKLYQRFSADARNNILRFDNEKITRIFRNILIKVARQN
jgi:glycosyltransferase involved in cell wall biosynthesis